MIYCINIQRIICTIFLVFEIDATLIDLFNINNNHGNNTEKIHMETLIPCK